MQILWGFIHFVLALSSGHYSKHVNYVNKVGYIMKRILGILATSCHILPHLATSCHILPHLATSCQWQHDMKRDSVWYTQGPPVLVFFSDLEVPDLWGCYPGTIERRTNGFMDSLFTVYIFNHIYTMTYYGCLGWWFIELIFLNLWLYWKTYCPLYFPDLGW